MNILMLLEAPYPADIRVHKEATALIKAGYNVHLLCIHKKGLPRNEEVDGIKVHRITVGQSDYILAFWDVINAINFYHPLFSSAISSMVKQHNIDAIHVHDLPLAGTALKIRAKLNVKVVLDLHENYPEALKVWHQWKKNPIARLKNRWFLHYNKWIKYEASAAKNSDHIICVVDEMKQRLIDQHNIASEKITVVTNSEESSFTEQPLNPEIYGEHKEKFIITYTGGIGPHRGVDTLIEGMNGLKKYEDIVLFIAGSGSSSVMLHLQALIRKYNLESRVFLLGYQPFSNFYSLMKFTTVNAIPHHSNEHTDNTIPHKLFQGMMTGKPLIVSSSTAIQRVVRETSSGLIFEAGNVQDFVIKLEELYHQKALRIQLGKNGENAALRGKYNWKETAKMLIKTYEDLG